jgi:hypothetical protein
METHLANGSEQRARTTLPAHVSPGKLIDREDVAQLVKCLTEPSNFELVLADESNQVLSWGGAYQVDRPNRGVENLPAGPTTHKQLCSV